MQLVIQRIAKQDHNKSAYRNVRMSVSGAVSWLTSSGGRERDVETAEFCVHKSSLSAAAIPACASYTEKKQNSRRKTTSVFGICVA